MKFSEWLIGKIGKWLSKESEPPNTHLTDFESLSYETRPGDVLLIEGRNRVSRIIRQITHSPWSHSALCIGRLNDINDPKLREQILKYYNGPSNTQLIIESLLGKGTVITQLAHYKDFHVRICRPQGLSRNDAQKVIAYAIKHLGHQYNIRQVFDLFRFFFPYGILPRRWRSVLFQHNAMQPTADICSSMIAEAFSSVNFPILPIICRSPEKKLELIQRNPMLYVPSDFDYSPYFSIIKYPFFNLSGHTSYHDLPWKKTEV